MKNLLLIALVIGTVSGCRSTSRSAYFAQPSTCQQCPKTVAFVPPPPPCPTATCPNGAAVLAPNGAAVLPPPAPPVFRQ